MRRIIIALKDKIIKKHTAKKKICILAYEDFHASVVHSIIQICNYKKNYVKVITINFIENQLLEYLGEDKRKVCWEIIPVSQQKGIARREEDTRIRLGISSKVSTQKYWDMIIIPSVEYNHRDYEPVLQNSPKNTEVVAVIHNLNYVFSSQTKNPDLYCNIGHASSYAVLNNLLIEEINKRKLTDKKVYEFPVLFWGNDSGIRQYENEKTTFVITGSVEKERKDYDLILEVFSKLKGYYNQLSLVLLGPARKEYGEGIIQRCIELREEGLSVQFFENFVPTKMFQSIIREADYILGPVNIQFITKQMTEVYGLTKLTGIMADMIEYAKPGIVPDNLSMPDKLKSSTIFFQSGTDLEDIIVSLLDKEIRQKYAINALENSRKYTLDNYLVYSFS